MLGRTVPARARNCNDYNKTEFSIGTPVVPSTAPGKGGRLLGGILRAKLVHQVAQATIAIAELLCDLLQRALLHKEGSQRFIATVQGSGGLDKEMGLS